MRKSLLVFLAVLGLAPLLLAQDRIEKIEIIGNERVTRETIVYYLSVQEGDHFDETLLRKDFRVLWSTGFFANIRIESEQGREGKIVKIIVEENPLIKDVKFQTGKSVKEGDIVTKLKENDQNILPYSHYSPSRVQKIKSTIEGMLAEKGLRSGTVTVDLDKRGKNEVGLVFRVEEGSRIKVGDIVFEGAPDWNTGRLLGAMKGNKKHDLLSMISGKDNLNTDKLGEDLAQVKKKLQEKGYMEAVVGVPRIDEMTRRNLFFKKQKMVRIVVPLSPGERYMVGDIKIEGNKIVSTNHLLTYLKIESGDIYSASAREKAVEKITEIYRDIGHLYIQAIPVETLDPKNHQVHLSLNIQEGEPAYLHRLEFKGNTFTKDKVLRRELLLREGDRFSLAYFKDSVLRLKQLGLVDVEKDPDIVPRADDPAQVDVTVNVRELQRNNLQFSAGYSGYDGTFLSLGYSTVNLMGMGENLDATVQFGKRIKNYSLSFTEPYFLDMPVSMGASIFDRYTYYPGLFKQESQGVHYSVGTRIAGYWRTSITYGFEYMNVSAISADDDDEEAAASYYNPYYGGGSYGYGHYYVGSLTPSLYMNTVDSPLMPSRGSLYSVSCKIAGGILGGEIDMIKPSFEWSRYQPFFKKTVIGLHVTYEFIKSLGSAGIPFWERFFLGGERSIRGYEIYSIGPLNSSGINQGGEKSLVINTEYIIPLGGPVNFIAFFDAGNAFTRHATVDLGDLYTSAGLEMRIFVPALRVPFRLIFARNNRLTTYNSSHLAFRFAVGTTF
jgi:outer membrane protein insertion porin family